jgi:hypothetical protein
VVFAAGETVMMESVEENPTGDELHA